MGKFFSLSTEEKNPKIKTKKVMLASLTGGSVVTTCCDQSSGSSLSPQGDQPPACVSINLIASDPIAPTQQEVHQVSDENPAKFSKDEEERSDQTAGSVRQLRLAFIGLIRLKRLQYFYLGALIYSVIYTMLTFSVPTTCPSSSIAELNVVTIGAIAFLIIVPALLLVAITLRSALEGYEWACRWTRPVGLACALCLLELPALVLAFNSQTFGCGRETSARVFVQTLIILYLVPILFEGSRVGVALGLAFAGFVSVLPAQLISIRSYSAKENYQLHSEIQVGSWILTSLIAGYMRRFYYTYLTGECAFLGADQLIEAKVGLEHQRQQQETLLLSVLPAYVAEQVKRNMVKKITCLQPSQADASGDSQQQQQPAISTFASIGISVPQSALNPADGNQSSVPLTAGDLSSSRVLHYTQNITSETKSTPVNSVNLLELPNRLTPRNSFLSRASPSGSAYSGGQIAQGACTSNQQQLSMVGGHARRGFNELYIRTYNNVSLLYGDIVGFTKLCTQLSSSQLVRVLNDLFSHFDHLAERHRIMRIKILGDCYYGVAGIPEFAVTGSKSHKLSRHHVDNHAINCVNMGLDMIHYIRRLNIERASQSSSSSSIANPVTVIDNSASANNMPAFELNMRIGIHTGHIHSGVIGLKKWQFDVWSNDVSIAMHCESSGVAGRIQVTQATIQQLEGAFTYELAQGAQRDSFLAAKDIKTYLIRDRSHHMNNCNLRALLPQPTIPAHRLSSASRSLNQEQQKQQPSDEENIRAATIGTIRQTLLSGCEQAQSLSSSDSTRELSFNWHDLQPFTLSFRDKTMARLYKQRQTGGLFYESLVTGSLLLLLIYNLTSLQSLSHASFSILSLITEGSTGWLCPFVAFVLALVLLVSCPQDGTFGQERKVTNWLLNKKAMSSFTGRFKRARTRLRTSLRLGKLSKKTRNLSSTLIAFTVITIECYSIVQHQCSSRDRPPLDAFEKYLLTVILLLICLDSSVNLLGYRTKMSLIGSVLIVHLLPLLPAIISQKITDYLASNLLISRCSTVFTVKQESLSTDWFSWALALVMILWSFVLAAQVEYANRTSFLWRNKLNVDHEELEYISGINKVLLENILPSHVVQHYLTQPPTTGIHTLEQGSDEWSSSLSQQQQQLTASLANLQSYMRMSFSSSSNHELYHEQHESVAVMFASIPHFYEFYDESNISKQGLGCIALLNEIICDFDKLLLKNKFSRIEKIKTIGSTYMAASGLRPNSMSSTRNSTASQMSVSTCGSIAAAAAASGQTSSGNAQMPHRNRLDTPAGGCALEEQKKQVLSQQKLNLICMIQFASSLMSALNGINKQSFQVFKLRVGVNAGSVIAGVIGAQRPFYDIWGDCVNIASRMESLGEVGRIQVEEKTANLLMESLCTENYSIVRRGPIDVKGKGGMVTYFVDKKENNSTLASSGEQMVGINCTGKSLIGVDSVHPHHHLGKNDADAINHQLNAR